MDCRIEPVEGEIMLLTQKGNVPRHATQKMRQMTATRSSHVASVSSRKCLFSTSP